MKYQFRLLVLSLRARGTAHRSPIIQTKQVSDGAPLRWNGALPWRWSIERERTNQPFGEAGGHRGLVSMTKISRQRSDYIRLMEGHQTGHLNGEPYTKQGKGRFTYQNTLVTNSITGFTFLRQHPLGYLFSNHLVLT